MKEDFEWYMMNCAELFAEFGDKYVVIKGKKVLGAYDSYGEGVRAAQKTEPLGSFIVQKCGNDESAYTNYISSMNFSL